MQPTARDVSFQSWPLQLHCAGERRQDTYAGTAVPRLLLCRAERWRRHVTLACVLFTDLFGNLRCKPRRFLVNGDFVESIVFSARSSTNAKECMWFVWTARDPTSRLALGVTCGHVACQERCCDYIDSFVLRGSPPERRPSGCPMWLMSTHISSPLSVAELHLDGFDGQTLQCTVRRVESDHDRDGHAEAAQRAFRKAQQTYVAALQSTPQWFTTHALQWSQCIT